MPVTRKMSPFDDVIMWYGFTRPLELRFAQRPDIYLNTGIPFRMIWNYKYCSKLLKRHNPSNQYGIIHQRILVSVRWTLNINVIMHTSESLINGNSIAYIFYSTWETPWFLTERFYHHHSDNISCHITFFDSDYAHENTSFETMWRKM